MNLVGGAQTFTGANSHKPMVTMTQIKVTQFVLMKLKNVAENVLHHQCVLPKGRSFTANSGTKAAVLLGMNRCSSFLLLSTPHSLSLASEQTLKDLKRSQGPQRGGEESGFG